VPNWLEVHREHKPRQAFTLQLLPETERPNQGLGLVRDRLRPLEHTRPIVERLRRPRLARACVSMVSAS
jgi:hypothetical protein